MKKIMLSSVLMVQALCAEYPPTGVLHDIAVDFQNTFSTLNTLNEEITCQATLITASSIGTAGYTINAAGNYRLIEDVSFSPGASGQAILINASDVYLDLCGSLLAQGNTQSDVSGVRISSSLSNVSITGGRIANFTRAGIEVSANVVRPYIAGTTFSNNARAVYYNGSAGQFITQAHLDSIEVIQSSTALDCNYLQYSMVENIVALQSAAIAVDINNSYTNIFSNIAINKVQNFSGNAYGISLSGGANNTVIGSSINAVQTRSTDATNAAYGIHIASDEIADVIRDTSISNVTSVSSAQPYGIGMNYNASTVLSTTGAPSTAVTGNSYRVEWSHNGRYIAVASFTGGFVYIFEYSSTGLMLVTSFAAAVQDVAWSSRDSYLAITNTNDVQIYSFAGTVASLVASATHGASIQSVDWSYDNRYVMIGGQSSGGIYVRIYLFNGSSLTQVATISSIAAVSKAKFAPNTSNVFALCGAAVGGIYMYVYTFDGTNITQVASTGAGAVGAWPNLDWSYDGRYIAAACANDNLARLYLFTGSALTFITNASHSAFVESVAWSPTGKNLIVGGDTGSGISARNYSFDGQAVTLVSTLPTGSIGAVRAGISWSPTGEYISFAVNNLPLYVTRGYEFPLNHKIMNCAVQGIEGTMPSGFSSIAIANGVGIQASTEHSVAAGNRVSFSDAPYIATALERYQEFILNLATRNQFPNRISNINFPPLI